MRSGAGMHLALLLLATLPLAMVALVTMGVSCLKTVLSVHYLPSHRAHNALLYTEQRKSLTSWPKLKLFLPLQKKKKKGKIR